MKAMTISKIANEAGVGVETIRFYERKELIAQPPKPPSGGYRIYPDKMVKQIRFIRQAQALGFSLRQIRELLSLRMDPETDCSDVRERAQAKLKEVTQKIAQMKRIQRALKTLIASCPGQGPLQICSVIEAIEDPATIKTGTKQTEETS